MPPEKRPETIVQFRNVRFCAGTVKLSGLGQPFPYDPIGQSVQTTPVSARHHSIRSLALPSLQSQPPRHRRPARRTRNRGGSSTDVHLRTRRDAGRPSDSSAAAQISRQEAWKIVTISCAATVLPIGDLCRRRFATSIAMRTTGQSYPTSRPGPESVPCAASVRPAGAAILERPRGRLHPVQPARQLVGAFLPFPSGACV